MKRVIDMTDEDVGEIVERCMRRMLQTGQLEVPRNDRWMKRSEVCRKYSIGHTRFKQLCESGQLPASARIFPGGKEGWVVRPADAERVLSGNALPVMRVL